MHEIMLCYHFLEAQVLCQILRLTHSLLGRVAFFGLYFRCLWIALEVLYGFATWNLVSNPFLMVAGVRISGIGGGGGVRILRDF